MQYIYLQLNGQRGTTGAVLILRQLQELIRRENKKLQLVILSQEKMFYAARGSAVMHGMGYNCTALAIDKKIQFSLII